MNPFDLFQLKAKWNTFEKNHPKFCRFLGVAAQKGIREGSVIEITITNPEGDTICSNLKVKKSDLDLLKSLGGK